MIYICAGMNRVNNELIRTQNENMLPFFESFALFASFAVCDLFHRKARKGRKDNFVGIYAINHRERREHREKWQSIAIPAMVYEKVAASRFRTRMTQIARIFADIVDYFAAPFHSPNKKPQRSQRTQNRMKNFCALRVLDDGLALFTSWITRIYTYPRVSASSAQSAQSAFHRRSPAFICVHPRLISVSLSDRAQYIIRSPWGVEF